MRLYNRFSVPFLICCLILIAGCSTTKDGFLNRAYHNTTSRYNGYYHSRESIKEGLATLALEHKEDYEEVLPIYLIAENEEEAGKVVGNMDRAITKSTTVIKHHSMKISNKERCRWIDDNYMAVARANFYKRDFKEAERIFEFVTREYPKLPTKYDAQFWLSRTYVEQGKLDEAGLLLSSLSQDKEMPAKKKGEFYKAYAHYYISRENYGQAADQLLRAVPLEKKKKNRNRLNYILAQLYQRVKGKEKDAIRYYELVAQKSNDYVMVFNARIFQATSAGKLESYRIKDELLKMLKDDKNIEFQDQIYYALGELSSRERKNKDALDYWKKSSEVSTTNVKQKSKSFLRVAQYYFDQKQYTSAAVFYDSAVSVLPVNFPEADEIKLTAKNLNDLVKELNTIETQDSLLALSKLKPEELDKRLGQIAKQLQKKADEEAALQQQKLNAPALAPKTTAPGTLASAGDFYFYNTNAKNLGYNDFKKKWGSRKLEDNWRRKNKSEADGGTGGFDTDPNAPDSTATAAAGVVVKKEDLKKDIPVSNADIVAANNKIIEALYASGNIYKEKFRDNDNSIASFANLVQRYDTSRYECIAYYQLYRLYIQKEKDGKYVPLDLKSTSSYYKDLILIECPESEFARLVENPEYLKMAQANAKTDMADYYRVFQLYKQASYTDALLASDSLISERPASPIAPKFYFLKSRIQSELHNVDGMVQVLTAITIKFPKTPEATEAQRILDILKKKIPASTTDTTAAVSTVAAIDSAAAKTAPLYKIDANAQHYFTMIFPNNGIDPAPFKAAIMNFNTANFPATKLEITSTFIDNDNQIILLKAFPNKTEAMNYYQAFISDKKFLKNINSKPENKSFIITVDNFISLFKLKKIDDYLKFFSEEYTK